MQPSPARLGIIDRSRPSPQLRKSRDSQEGAGRARICHVTEVYGRPPPRIYLPSTSLFFTSFAARQEPRLVASTGYRSRLESPSALCKERRSRRSRPNLNRYFYIPRFSPCLSYPETSRAARYLRVFGIVSAFSSRTFGVAQSSPRSSS